MERRSGIIIIVGILSWVIFLGIVPYLIPNTLPMITFLPHIFFDLFMSIVFYTTFFTLLVMLTGYFMLKFRDRLQAR